MKGFIADASRSLDGLSNFGGCVLLLCFIPLALVGAVMMLFALTGDDSYVKGRNA